MAWAESTKKTSARIIVGDLQYEEYTTTGLYVERVFPADVTHIILANDGDSDVQISFDGATLDGELKARETVALDTAAKGSIFLKSDVAGQVVRYWAC